MSQSDAFAFVYVALGMEHSWKLVLPVTHTAYKVFSIIQSTSICGQSCQAYTTPTFRFHREKQASIWRQQEIL